MTPQEAPGGDGWREPAGWLLAAILLMVMVFGYLMPATRYFTAVPGDMADPRYNSVALEHLYRFMTGNADLWNPDFFYPFKGTLAFSDNHFGSGATYVLARLLGLSREHAFDVWFVAGTLLNFASALYVLRRLGLSTAAAALGAFFFAFALPVPPQDTHAQLVHRFPVPLAVLALWQTFERRQLIDFARLAFFAVWQFYCSIYLGLFLCYLLAALTVAIVIVRRPGGWPQWRANLAGEPLSIKLVASGTLLISIVAFTYLVGNYFLVSHSYGLWRPVETIAEFLPRPGSYLLADNSPLLSWLGRDINVPARWEHQMFVGFGAIAMIFSAVVVAWRGGAAVPGLTQVMLIALALLIAGTLWVDGFTLYHLVVWLPGIDGVRGVSRIILIMLMPVSVLVALGADAAWKRVGRVWAAPVLAGLAILVILEPISVHTAGTPIASWRARFNAARALLPPSLPRDAILMLRTSSPDIDELVLVELDAMLLGQELGYPVLNGHSGFHPPGHRLQACASAADYLRGYFVFMRGNVRIADYSRRLVVLDLDACPHQ